MSILRTALLTGFAATAGLAEAQYLNPHLQQVNDALMIELRNEGGERTPDKKGQFVLTAKNEEGESFMAKFADDGDRKFSAGDSLVSLKIDGIQSDSTQTIPTYTAERNAQNGFDITQSTLKVGEQHRNDENITTIVPGSKRPMGNAPDTPGMLRIMVGLHTGRLPLRLE
jgi:hypothetical protein